MPVTIHPSQFAAGMSQAFSLRCNALPDDVSVMAFRGAEGVSELYAIGVYVIGSAGMTSSDLDDAVGASATLAFGDGTISGVVAEVELVGLAGARPIFVARLVPRLWLLTQSQHSRVFTDMTLPAILEEVFERGGLASDHYRIELEGSYAPRSHVCQYRESDYDFLARWMEREGLYYFFEQGEEAEKLIITDTKATHQPLRDEAVRFLAGGGGGSQAPGMRSFRCKQRLLTSKVQLTDYDPLHPDTTLSGASPSGDGDDLGAIHDHRGRFREGDRGTLLAKRQAEARACQRRVARGRAASLGLRSGYTFALQDHPDTALDDSYLVTRLVHRGLASAATPALRQLTGVDIDGTYECDVVAIPADVQYRSPARTRWPRMSGFESALVDGPADGDAPQLDEHGRYRVKFLFDESDRADGRASTWLRLVQPHAGTPEGFHFPLRKGTEVMIAFESGDPDRPIIAGAVPQATRPSPVVDDNARSSVIHTAGDNHLELGDDPEAQFITLSSPNNSSVFRLGKGPDGRGDHGESGNATHTIVLKTDGDKDEKTEGDQKETITGKKELFVGGANVETIMGFETGTIIGLKTTQMMAGMIKVVIGAVSDTIIGAEGKNVIGGQAKLIVGGAPIAEEIDIIGVENTNILGGRVTNLLGGELKFVGGVVQETILGGINKNVLGGTVELIGGGVSKTILGGVNNNLIGGAINLVGGAEGKAVVGGEIGVIAPLDMKVVMGMVIDIILGVKAVAVAGATLEIEGIEVETLGDVVKEVSSDIKTFGSLAVTMGTIISKG